MVWVDGGRISPQVFRSGRMPAIDLPPFLIDALEVTNGRFQAFVDAGSIASAATGRSHSRDRQLPSWEEAMAAFVDRTGRQGPATWRTGVTEGSRRIPWPASWFEAAAFADFEASVCRPSTSGTRRRACWSSSNRAGTTPSSSAGRSRPRSNFGSSGLVAGGSEPGMGPYGTEDLAGNVREWAWNGIGSRRAILGGAWTGSPLDFLVGWGLEPFDRAEVNGFRLVRHAAGAEIPAAATVPVPEGPDPLSSSALDPVNDEVFGVLRGYYSYDASPLESRVETRSDTESISFVRSA
jgi:formylglycine-generating enzyme required for sulfatase activity